MSTKTCCVCDAPATIVDTEYEELYCIDHAEDYEVFDGPWREMTEEDHED